MTERVLTEPISERIRKALAEAQAPSPSTARVGWLFDVLARQERASREGVGA